MTYLRVKGLQTDKLGYALTPQKHNRPPAAAQGNFVS